MRRNWPPACFSTFPGKLSATKRLYGLHEATHEQLRPARCLIARRLVEAGVRFVQSLPAARAVVSAIGQPRRTRPGQELGSICGQDWMKPAAALVTDLKSRGLLEDTIVIWAGEFGRLPVSADAITTATPSASSWPAAASKAASPMARPTSSATRQQLNRVSVPDLRAHPASPARSRPQPVSSSAERGIDETPTDAKVSGAKVVRGILRENVSERPLTPGFFR